MTKYILGEICSISSGGTPKRSNNDFYFPATIPWVKIGDLGKHIYVSKTKEFISKDGLVSIGNRTFPKGTILLAMYGATLGKTGIADIELSANQAILGINSLDANILSNIYLKYWLDFNVDRFQFQGKGGTYKNLSKTYISGLTIMLPDINRQLEIINRFEKIQELIQKRNQTIELLDEYLIAVFIEMFGDPNENPFNWKKLTLADVTNKISDGTHKTPTYVNEGIVFISATNVNNNKIDWDKVKYITGEEYKQLLSRGIPELGDIFMTKSGTLGRTAVIDKDMKFSFYESLALLKVDKQKIESYFLNQLLNTNAVQFNLMKKKKGIAVKHLHLRVIKKIEVIIPPIEIQVKFKEVFLKIEYQLEQLLKSKQLLEEQFESLIYQTFSPEKEGAKDEIQALLDDELMGQEFFETIENSDFQSFEQYNIEVEKLRKLLIKTKEEKAKDKNYKKGIVQILKDEKVQLRINKDYLNELSDEVTKA